MPSESVKVAVRVRPFNQREKNAKSKCIISMKDNSTTITNPATGEKKVFAYDHSYWSHDGYNVDPDGIFVSEPDHEPPYADQQNVFNDLGRGVLDNAWQGYNAALFAYGQTGSGKSYSMIGYGPNKGIVPITCGQLFKAIDENNDDQKQFQVTFSMLEIYNEHVRDLLTAAKSQPAGGLRVRQHPQTGFYVDGLKQIPTDSYKQIQRLMDQGTVNRTTASTDMNATSSRSHMVITITFKQIYKNDRGQSTTKSSRISLVDLAGSERAASTGATGDRLKEGSAINQSLSTLGNVISSLADKANGKSNIIVPYRDSVLTKLLQSALGGNSKQNWAKSIKNQATINESPTDKLIRELKAEKLRLLEELKKLKSGQDSNSEEVEDLLEENRRQMADINLTWEQRMEEARAEWEKSLQENSQDSRLRQVPYLQNINEDPYLSGVVKLPLEDGVTTLGKPNGSNDHTNYIDIRGLRIQINHAKFENKGNKVLIEPGSRSAEIRVNGKRITRHTKLHHLDRIKLGSNNLYLYVGYPEERTDKDDIQQYDYDFFQSELADGAGMGTNLMRSMSVVDSHETDPGTIIVFQHYSNILSKVYEANAMSEEMEKGVIFEAVIKNLTGHDALGRPRDKEVVVRVTSKPTKKVWIWSEEKFLNRKYMIEEMYMRWLEGEDVKIDKTKDPFWDPVEDIYLGSCHVWLNNVAYCMDSEDYMDIRDHHGKEVAQLHVSIAPCDKKGRLFKDETVVFDPSQLEGRRLDFMIMVPQGRDVLWVKEDNTRGVYFSFSFYDHPKPIKSKVIWESMNPHFDFKQHISIPQVGQDLLKYLQSHALVVELLGTQVPEKEKHLSKTATKISKSAEIRIKELQYALAKKEAEVTRLRAERDKARKHLEKFKPLDLRRDSSSSESPYAMVVNDPCPSPRRKTPLLRSNSAQGPIGSLDSEMAKAMKVFFRDVKTVQKKLDIIKANDADVLALSDLDSLQTVLKQQHNDVVDVDTSLAETVGTLKEAMMTIIKRKKQQDAQHNGDIMNEAR
ncbi:hypothetical protein LSH36_154g12000 [Paralvinella palmiformis]|uniref:Kinesin-like protein 6 n=1 Tax=Paralvinella palmiformis TaxID=53620 RepID=A0AAD9JU18_9ANNE|nr:hypothetical protein LSH36_154g12000 [Paralvinella palmiformis]